MNSLKAAHTLQHKFETWTRTSDVKNVCVICANVRRESQEEQQNRPGRAASVRRWLLSGHNILKTINGPQETFVHSEIVFIQDCTTFRLRKKNSHCLIVVLLCHHFLFLHPCRSFASTNYLRLGAHYINSDLNTSSLIGDIFSTAATLKTTLCGKGIQARKNASLGDSVGCGRNARISQLIEGSTQQQLPNKAMWGTPQAKSANLCSAKHTNRLMKIRSRSKEFSCNSTKKKHIFLQQNWEWTKKNFPRRREKKRVYWLRLVSGAGFLLYSPQIEDLYSDSNWMTSPN